MSERRVLCDENLAPSHSDSMLTHGAMRRNLAASRMASSVAIIIVPNCIIAHGQR